MTKLLVVFGEGGHTKELLNLVALMGDAYEYSYLMTYQDRLAALNLPVPGPIYRVLRPRHKIGNPLWAGIRTLAAAIQSLVILIKVSPDAIVSSGPAVAVPISVVGKLLGKQVIFIENASRVTRLSLTGRILYHWADLFFVQWPALEKLYPKAIYAGRLL